MTEAASMLNLSPATVLRQIRAGIIPAQQYCMGAPWVIKSAGSVCLNSLRRLAKWISALIMLPPSSVSAR
ncbi:helix-turn-helix domain-containing protein [Mesorhizobium sp. M0933]|uniref:helix-turn-helix domain-containing protein n=1 Tax=Mesorhizobium sp. M0933 TaxID=2957030 RepID=UPI00333DF8C2